MKKFIIKLAAVTGIIVIIAGISALATEFSLVTLAIVFAAIITENALCGAYLGKNKHSKKYVYVLEESGAYDEEIERMTENGTYEEFVRKVKEHIDWNNLQGRMIQAENEAISAAIDAIINKG